ncbi:MAG: hypothetical protein HZA58_06310 [Acidimicrobiia bacterium]|nr:hypothetical protein [Acidimicrobiia bacterium]
MSLRRWSRLLSLAFVITSCQSGGGTTTTQTVVTTAVVTTSKASTTTTVVVGVDVIALPVAGESMGPEWTEALFIPYGDTEETLGTSPGGEGGSMDLGPEYGAQGPDGTWWFLDAAKTRLARYSADGVFRDALPVPEGLLVDGVYFQFQLPRVLADGTLIAIGHRDDHSVVLRADADGIDQVDLPGIVVPRVDDGVIAYGFDHLGTLQAVDPIAGTMAPTEWFVTQTGTRFLLEMSVDGLRIVLPDAAVRVDRVVPLVTAADEDIPAFGSMEAATTADGRIHVLLLGASSADESLQLGGYFTILPDGTVTPVVAVRSPFTLSDPGSPAHLGAAYGAGEPWFMVVDTDGVRIYRPSAA